MYTVWHQQWLAILEYGFFDLGGRSVFTAIGRVPWVK